MFLQIPRRRPLGCFVPFFIGLLGALATIRARGRSR